MRLGHRGLSVSSVSHSLCPLFRDPPLLCICPSPSFFMVLCQITSIQSSFAPPSLALCSCPLLLWPSVDLTFISAFYLLSALLNCFLKLPIRLSKSQHLIFLMHHIAYLHLAESLPWQQAPESRFVSWIATAVKALTTFHLLLCFHWAPCTHTIHTIA